MRLQQQKQLKALNQEQERARLAEQEKHLIARPVWTTQQDDPWVLQNKGVAKTGRQ